MYVGARLLYFLLCSTIKARCYDIYWCDDSMMMLIRTKFCRPTVKYQHYFFCIFFSPASSLNSFKAKKKKRETLTNCCTDWLLYCTYAWFWFPPTYLFYLRSCVTSPRSSGECPLGRDAFCGWLLASAVPGVGANRGGQSGEEDSHADQQGTVVCFYYR